MKKFLASVLALVCVMVMVLSIACAEDITLSGSDAGNCVEGMEKIFDLSKEGSLTLVVKMTDAEHYGWGLGNFGANVDGAWTDSKIAAGGEIACADENEAKFTYTFKEIVESFGVTDAASIADLKFGTWNGGVIVSMSYEYAGAAPVDDSAKTADAMNVAVVAGLALIALAGVVVVANKKNA